MSRDSQRQRLYNAEDLVRQMLDAADKTESRAVRLHGSVFTLPVERKFGDLSTVQMYLDRILARPDIRSLFPETSRRGIQVRFRKGNRKAHYEPQGVIAVNVPQYGQGWAMREIVVLHELAHHLAYGDGHGQEFAGTMHYLVEEIIGPEVAFLLQDSFRNHDVSWSPVRHNVA